MSETLTPFDSGAARKPRWGDECSVRFERLDERGHSVGAVGDFRLLERGGALGALARVRVLSRRRSDLEVRTLEVLEPGPHTVPARCVHHGVCGGCTFQATAYGAQLEFRARALQEVLSAAGVAHGLDEVVASPEVWNYRNKMDFTFGTRRWSEVAGADVCPGALTLGLFPRGVHSKVLEIRRCEIAFGAAAAIVESTRRLARDLCFDAYDTVAQGGFLRHLLLRRSWADGEILAALVTTAEAPAAGPEAFAALVEALAAAHPEVTTWVQLVNPGRALVAVGEREIVLRGRGAIRERLAGHDFEVRAGSFFQVNTPAAEALIERVLAAADVRPGDVIHDLYSGCGTISLALARRAGPGARVHGFEWVESAVLAAREAASRNGLADVVFHAGDVLDTWRAEHGRAAADVVVADPPRAGLHPKVAAALAASTARSIVLVACEARSGARDAALLLSAGWSLERVLAVDLFPHTPHLECVFAFRRKP